MKSFERYRRYAVDCLKMAQSAGNEALLLQMAETWRQLAERLPAAPSSCRNCWAPK
jgi:hypothetical protein